MKSRKAELYLIEILHQTTTPLRVADPEPKLYLIEILHQTTTGYACYVYAYGCILLKFYIKPQRYFHNRHDADSCILLKFYIKPQRVMQAMMDPVVVSY